MSTLLHRALRVLTLAVLLIGCGAQPDEPPKDAGPPDGPPCASGETLLDDGRCQPAGLPLDMPPCAPGEALLDGGTCQKAGVPPDACGEGFIPDGQDGCEAILPPAPCPAGLMAVPGMTTCQEVAPCGAGTWGDIPVDATTQYVDQAYAGGGSDGSAAKPWTTIQDGIDAADPGAVVAVAAGSYAHVLIQDNPVKLWGRCPDLVSVVGDNTFSAIRISTASASKSEVHSLAATGQRRGLLVSGATDVVATSVWIHDTGMDGIQVNDLAGPASISVTGALVEGTHETGMFFSGASATVEKSAVRDTQAGAAAAGEGVVIQEGAQSAPVEVSIRRSLIERNYYTGVGVAGSGMKLAIESTVVRDTQLDPTADKGYGVGSLLHASMTIKQAVIERNHGQGVLVAGADVTIEATVVRDTEVDMAGVGAGVVIGIDEQTSTRGTATIRSSLIEGSTIAGVAVLQSDATIESTLIRDTQEGGGYAGSGLIVGDDVSSGRSSLTVRSSLVENTRGLGISAVFSDLLIESTVVRGTLALLDGHGGYGIEIGDGDDDTSKVTIRGSLVEQNTEVGVLVGGADVLIESTTVRDNAPAGDGTGSTGIAFQAGPSRRTTGTIRSCLIDQNSEEGILLASTDATVESTIVRATHTSAMGQFGDGIVVIDYGAGASQVTLTGNRIEASARAGLSNFGGSITFGSNALVCSAFDIEGEEYMGAFSLDDQGGNVCGCPEADHTCKVRSASLAPPPPIAPMHH
jgi:hypothetical protein